MSTEGQEQTKRSWLSLPIIVTITRLLCRELTLQNEYLKTENKILKSKIKNRLVFTDDERRTLVEAALAMGKDLMKEVVSIVKPETILVWQRRLEKQKWDSSDRKVKKQGRPGVNINIEQLVCQMARENIWGYARIEGELQKLGIKLCKNTIANILRRNKLPPSPERKGLTWREFLSRHADTFLCADLFTKEVWTFRGLKTVFVFFVIHLQSRRVILAKATFSPNSAWIKQQLRHTIWECEDQGLSIDLFLRDNDSCYSKVIFCSSLRT
jgi:putative transposase